MNVATNILLVLEIIALSVVMFGAVGITALATALAWAQWTERRRASKCGEKAQSVNEMELQQ